MNDERLKEIRKPNATCEQCGSTFYKKPAESRRTRHAFCSKPCRGKWLKTQWVETFMSRVEKSADCWLWKGNVNANGYGTCRTSGIVARAHRASWTLAHGEIPKGMQVLHRCDNPPCVNPDHLFLGTHIDNMIDKASKGRARRKLTADQERFIGGSVLKSTTLAMEFGVAERTIRNIRRRRSVEQEVKP
jgi:hypothetical protein